MRPSQQTLYSLYPSQATGHPSPISSYCIPGAGANVTSFLELAAALSLKGPVWGFQHQGLDGQLAPHTSVEAAATYYVEALLQDTPHATHCRLIGHSFGGWIAFDMAKQLETRGIALLPLILIDADPPSDMAIKKQIFDEVGALLELDTILAQSSGKSLDLCKIDLKNMSQPQRIEALKAAMVKVGLLSHQSPLPILEAMFKVFHTQLNIAYTPSPYNGKVVLFKAAESSEKAVIAADTPTSLNKSGEAIQDEVHATQASKCALTEKENRTQAKEELADPAEPSKNLVNSAQPATQWKDYAINLTEHILPGNHMSILTEPHVTQLAHCIFSAL